MVRNELPLPLKWGAVGFLSAAAVAAILVTMSEHRRMEAARMRAATEAAQYSDALQQTLERCLSSTHALAALVIQGKGEVPEFEQIAQQLLRFNPGAILQLAPNGIVRKIVPLEGNESAIGHDLLRDPERRAEALLAKDSGKLTLSGPFPLRQGGVGAVARMPVFLTDSMGKQRFWGFIVALLRFPDILAPARLKQLEDEGFRYELWRTNPATGKRQVIAASSGAPLVDPVEHPFSVPNGRWSLSIVAKRGWGDPIALAIKMVFGFLFSMMAGYIAHLLAKKIEHEQELGFLLEEQASRQEELSVRNQKLEIAIARIRTLEGIICICSYCNKIRNEGASWDHLESYISEHTDALFSHGICPECFEKQTLSYRENFQPRPGPTSD